MITRPVAVARALLVAGALWAAGGAAVASGFAAMDASATIELADHDRAQVVWLGAHAFVACVATLVGTVLGGVALTRHHVASPREAVGVTGVPVLVVTGLAAVVLASAEVFEGAAVWAVLAGLVIGTLAGGGYVVMTGEQSDRGPYGLPAATSRTSRTWSSR